MRRYLELRPAAYIPRHVHIAGSLTKRYEAEMRDEIGVTKLMWGADYPHLEGAVPVHREVLRHVFSEMPVDDVRAMLGGNAMELWDFDKIALQEAADKHGPTVSEVAAPLSLADFPETFSWSLARPVPLSAPI